jgi:antitoxin (DNA-binding transcriptional repressor) of toxin-antitoxin stability system
MINNMTMKKVNIHEAKAKLSEFIDAVERGEQVVICRRNRPVAELRAVNVARTTYRAVGGAKGRLAIPASFFAPLPDDLVGAFYEGERVRPEASVRVVEEPSPYGHAGAPGRRRSRPRTQAGIKPRIKPRPKP